MTNSLGVYISVPFCKAKCTYCNFASGVFAAGRIDEYVDRLCAEMGGLRRRVAEMRAAAGGVELPDVVDSIYFGGGTPSLLTAEQMRRVFAALRGQFAVSADAEVTLECAPGQLEDATLEEMLRRGMNRVSFGVQSFVDAEAKAVGRLHTREMCLGEITRMRTADVENINIDLIAGLPGQTAASWRESVDVALETRVPHVSVYMLEVDEGSRLGKEVLEHGKRYGAGAVPHEDEIADWYAAGCEWLEAAGVHQYEISNFARDGRASRHNVKYWRREPYVGFGLDAHSMLRRGVGGVRWANTDELDGYLAEREQGIRNREQDVAGSQLSVLGGVSPIFDNGAGPSVEAVGREQAFEEAMFLGLRTNEGVELEPLRAEFGEKLMRGATEALGDVLDAGLVVVEDGRIKLTARGRMASNEVFGRLLVPA